MEDTKRVGVIIDKEVKEAIEAILETYDIKPSRSAVIRQAVIKYAEMLTHGLPPNTVEI